MVIACIPSFFMRKYASSSFGSAHPWAHMHAMGPGMRMQNAVLRYAALEKCPFPLTGFGSLYFRDANACSQKYKGNAEDPAILRILRVVDTLCVANCYSEPLCVDAIFTGLPLLTKGPRHSRIGKNGVGGVVMVGDAPEQFKSRYV